MKDFDYLLFIAENQENLVKTGWLSKKQGVSQQAASLALRRLESAGYIRRDSTNRGVRARLTHIAYEELSGYRERLKALFGNRQIRGKVFTGLGEGRFYTRLPGYTDQFKELFGIDPFPGTLNLKVDKEEKIRFLSSKKKVKVSGFKDRQRSYGSLDCYLVSIKGLRAAAVAPERTTHKGTIEIISEKNLRKSLQVKDGDWVILR